MDKVFYSLPVYLQDKILPPKKRTLNDLKQDALKNASITPAIYRRAVGEYASASDHSPAAAGYTPATNRGVMEADSYKSLLPSFEALENLQIVALGKKGKYQNIAIPLPNKKAKNTHSFIDWVNFTFRSNDLPLTLRTGTEHGHIAITDDDYITALSYELEQIFGYGVTAKRQAGMNFYKSSWDLGLNGWGMVCIGGNRDSVLVTVKGQGLMAAKPGWESRLFGFLKRVKDSKITRIDLASDNFDSKTGLNDYLNMYRAGLFYTRGKAPGVECLGNWENPSGKGRTLYIGSRDSGKLLRIYEKGLQLSGGYELSHPNWVRTELELKNDQRIIPYDVLLNPGQYLAGAYPALANLHKEQVRIETNKKTAQLTFAKSVKTTNNQFGKYIWSAIQVLGQDEAIKQLTAGKCELPERLVFDTYEQAKYYTFIHQQKPILGQGVRDL